MPHLGVVVIRIQGLSGTVARIVRTVVNGATTSGFVVLPTHLRRERLVKLHPASKTKPRSPIKAPPLRVPGQSIRDEMMDVLFDKWLPYLMYPAVAWIYVMFEWIRWATHTLLSLRSCFVTTAIAVVVS